MLNPLMFLVDVTCSLGVCAGTSIMALFVESGSAVRIVEDAAVTRQASRNRKAQLPC